MVGERVVGGIMPMEGDEWGDLPSHWMIYFAVADTDRDRRPRDGAGRGRVGSAVRRTRR